MSWKRPAADLAREILERDDKEYYDLDYVAVTIDLGRELAEVVLREEEDEKALAP